VAIFVAPGFHPRRLGGGGGVIAYFRDLRLPWKAGATGRTE
jgi:hypothetical protein